MTDHPQAAVDALAAMLTSNLIAASPHPHHSARAILDTIAPLLTAELDVAYAEAHAYGAEREAWKARADEMTDKLAVAVEALKGLVDKQRSIEADVTSAHAGRGVAASSWMREDDNDFRRDLAAAFHTALAAINGETK